MGGRCGNVVQTRGARHRWPRRSRAFAAPLPIHRTPHNRTTRVATHGGGPWKADPRQNTDAGTELAHEEGRGTGDAHDLAQVLKRSPRLASCLWRCRCLGHWRCRHGSRIFLRGRSLSSGPGGFQEYSNTRSSSTTPRESAHGTRCTLHGGEARSAQRSQATHSRSRLIGFSSSSSSPLATASLPLSNPSEWRPSKRRPIESRATFGSGHLRRAILSPNT